MNERLIEFLQSLTATGAWICGLFFIRFWRETRDSLFAFFAAAFWLLALSWMLLALFNPTGEGRRSVYRLRLLAFLLIVLGMVQKNRQKHSRARFETA